MNTAQASIVLKRIRERILKFQPKYSEETLEETITNPASQPYDYTNMSDYNYDLEMLDKLIDQMDKIVEMKASALAKDHA